MTTLHRKKFANPDNLKKVKPERLLEFLKFFSNYFEKKGLVLDNTIENYDLLAQILMYPDDEMPEELVGALFFIYEMSDEDKWDVLYEAAKDNNVELDSDPNITAGDLATQLWMKAPKALEKLHAEILVAKPKSYEYFTSNKPPLERFNLPNESQRFAIESELNTSFEERKRGRGCKIFCFDYGQKVKFLIRHGKPFKREGCLKEDQSDMVFYRPEAHDVLVYDHKKNEIAINKSTNKWQKEIYMHVIGKHLFDDAEYFLGGEKFTLLPLRKNGDSSLVYTDIAGIEDVKLTEVHLHWQGSNRPREVRKADDYFSCDNIWDDLFPIGADITTVQFTFRLKGVKRSRSLRIDPPNVAGFIRDEHGNIMESFLRARGFELLAANAKENYEIRTEPYVECA